jgi:hypothetical protein
MKGTIVVQSEPQPDAIPLPQTRQSFGYNPVVFPVLGFDPPELKPVAVGDVAAGGDMLNIQIGFNRFSAMVDIYGAFVLSTNPNIVNVLNPDGTSFTSFTFAQILDAITTGGAPEGADPWRSGVMGPINEQLFNTLISNLPTGNYIIYLLVTPFNDLDNFYLWVTSFTSP